MTTLDPARDDQPFAATFVDDVSPNSRAATGEISENTSVSREVSPDATAVDAEPAATLVAATEDEAAAAVDAIRREAAEWAKGHSGDPLVVGLHLHRGAPTSEYWDNVVLVAVATPSNVFVFRVHTVDENATATPTVVPAFRALLEHPSAHQGPIVFAGNALDVESWCLQQAFGVSVDPAACLDVPYAAECIAAHPSHRGMHNSEDPTAMRFVMASRDTECGTIAGYCEAVLGMTVHVADDYARGRWQPKNVDRVQLAYASHHGHAAGRLGRALAAAAAPYMSPTDLVSVRM